MAVERLHNELERYRESPIGARIQSNIDLVSLEGRPAPRLDAREHLGRPMPEPNTLKGKVILLFFWGALVFDLQGGESAHCAAGRPIPRGRTRDCSPDAALGLRRRRTAC